MSTVATPFAAAYELELDVELPGAGAGPLQLFYPGAREAGGSSELLVKVTPVDGESWLANFAGGGFPLMAVTTCPDPKVFCVVVPGVGLPGEGGRWSRVV